MMRSSTSNKTFLIHDDTEDLFLGIAYKVFSRPLVNTIEIQLNKNFTLSLVSKPNKSYFIIQPSHKTKTFMGLHDRLG